MPRLWFNDAVGALDPSEIENISNQNLVGWWKAHKSDGTDDNFAISQYTTGRGADNKYYITQWDDSSSSGNHLTQLLGLGPQPHGDNVNNEGDVSDELNEYVVADFKGGVGGTQSLSLNLTPADPDDFTIGNTNNHLSFICVVRHHSTVSTPGITAGDNQFIIAAEKSSEAEDWAYGLYVASVGVTLTVVQRLAVYGDVDYAESTADLADDQYYVLGFFTEETLNYPQGGILSSSGPDLVDVGSSILGSVGTDGTVNTKVFVGREKSGASSTLDGRLVEMAAFKSTDPLSRLERLQLINYFKSKFAL